MIDLGFLDALEPDETDLPQLPQLLPKKLGQRKPNTGAVPRLPQLPQPKITLRYLKRGIQAAGFLNAMILPPLASPSK